MQNQINNAILKVLKSHPHTGEIKNDFERITVINNYSARIWN